MNELDQDVLICQLVREMHSHDSWVGETHIQKCSMFLQKLLDVPLSYEFVLYKYGPYSFDLSSDLAKMRVRFMLDVKPHPPYAPSFVLGTRGRRLVEVENIYEEQFAFVSEKLSSKDTRQLERVSTVFFIQCEDPELPDVEVAEIVGELKPHIDRDQALSACDEVSEIVSSARERFPNLNLEWR